MSDAPDFREPDPKGDKDTAIPRFYIDAQPNQRRSDEDGVPRFDDVEMVEILIPGDRNAVSVQMVTEIHRKRWPGAYARFKAGQEASEDGTPLEQLPGMTASQAQELRFMNVRTVEQLGDLTDEQARKSVSMGGMALRDRAKRWLDTTAGAAKEERLAAENRQQAEKIDELTGKVETLTKLVEDLTAKVPKETA
jgi:hypothetical protein